MSRCHTVVFAILVLIMAGCSSRVVEPKNKLPKDLQVMLEQSEQFELLSLSPKELPHDAIPEDAFHDWEVHGRTTVKNVQTRQKLVAALEQGIAENEGIVASCFAPRHGIRVTHGGKSADFVICFECQQVLVYVGDRREKGFLVTASPQTTFDSVLTDAKVPLAEKPKT